MIDLSKKAGAIMRELMLELLTYEPYGKLRPEENSYIYEILSGNYNPPQATLHALFSGFYSCVQNKKFEDIGWLQKWKAAHGRAPLPLLFKKICFYLMVDEERRANEKRKAKEEHNAKKKRSGSDFMEQIGLQVSRTRKWGISPQFRRYAEADTYSTIKSSRNGVKKPYIVSSVKKLYYEAGRQVSETKAQFEKESMTLKKLLQSPKESMTSKEPPWFVKSSMTLNDLPTFVDVFAGTGSVAASVVSEGCPDPIVNDYDPVMVCFAWAFTHRKDEMCKRIAEYHNYLMGLDFASTKWNYNTYTEDNDPQDLETTPEAWDDPEVLRTHMEFYGYSEDDIARDKRLAQLHKEFIIRTRSSYMAVDELIKKCNRNELRKYVDSIPSLSIAQVRKLLYYALLVFYYYSFEPGGPAGNYYSPTIVNTSSYFSYLDRLKVNLKAVKREAHNGNKENKAIKAKELMKLRLEPSSLNLKFDGYFSRYLQKAKFYCKDFRELLKITPSNAIYYWDSPYYLTVGYAVGFSDKDHKDMLDILRNAWFKWVFSMQYNSSDRCKCTSSSDEQKRKSQPHIIKDYGAYYRGFYAPFQLDADQRTYYVPTDAPMGNAKNLYVILFDFDEVKDEWEEMRNSETREMLVVNFNPLRTIPLHDSAVVFPFDLFLNCADKKMDYQKIVKLAVDWRKANIESKYADEIPV